MQIHTEGPFYDHAAFKPWRIQALALKAIRRLYPDYLLWRDFAYEYEREKLAIDVINGGPLLREWVDDAAATPQDLDALAVADKRAWVAEREGLCATERTMGRAQQASGGQRRVFAPCPRQHIRSFTSVGTLRFAHPTAVTIPRIPRPSA